MLVSNNILAAPGIVGLAADLGQAMRFRWYASGLAASFSQSFLGTFLSQSGATPRGWDGIGAPARPRPSRQALEKKEDRERKIARVEVLPGDITIETGQQAVFTAVAYDKDGASISGLNASWEGLDEEKNEAVSVSQRAVFVSGKPGKYKLTADVAGRKAHVKVTVVGKERLPNITSPPGEPISSNDQPKPKKISSLAPVNNDDSRVALRRGAKTASGRQTLRATASAFSPRAALFLPGEDDYGWNSGNYTTLDDPGTERGNMPGHALDGGAGSGNFQFAAPLLSLDGRGIDLGLGFNYNSRLWHKSGTDMYFDVDRDWIPGWSLGFGKIVMAGASYVMIDGDGTRHPYSGRPYSTFSETSLQTYEAYTTDGSFINYYAEGYKAGFDNSGGHNMVKAWAKLPNGTSVEYGAPANYAMYPKRITDANGNYITITYRTYTRYWNGAYRTVEEGPNIDTITDTVGRVIHFYYERQGTIPNETDRLTAVTAPGINGSAPRVLVRLQYDQKYLSSAGSNYGFESYLTTHVLNSGAINAIKAIYYPATGTGYWFGDADSYSNYGMLRKVSERRGMTCSVGGVACTDNNAAYLTQQPSVGAGSMSRDVVYSHHQNQPGYSGATSPINDTPTYTRMTEDWAARDTADAPVTRYSITDIGSTRLTAIARPDGVYIEQDTDDNPSSLYYSLLTEDRTYADDTKSTLLHRSTVTWNRTGDPAGDPDNTDPTYRSPRPEKTEVFDDRHQKTVTEYSYGTYYNQVVDKTEKGYPGTTLLHRTHTDYENGSSYRGNWTNRGMLWWHGPQPWQLYGGADWSGPHLFNLALDVSVYAADNTTRVAHNRYRYDEQSLVARTDAVQLASAPTQRGNLTTVKRYANAGTLDEATAVAETRGYDVCGNVVTMATSCCEQTSFEFNAGTQYGWPGVIRTAHPTDTSKQNITGYGYDLNTGLLVNSEDANARYSETYYQ